jgi:hypothetical protein
LVSAFLATCIGTIVLAAPAAAQAAPAATTVVLSGKVVSGLGVPVSGATVVASGPVTASTTTDSTGSFSLSVPQGLYSLDVRKGGYNPASLSSLSLVAGANQPVSITLYAADLSSLQTIGRVSSGQRGAGSTINTGTAAQSYLSGQAFSDLGNAQINNVLQELPDVTIQHMSSQQDTTIVLNGSQPYETQVLIDGHPLALGQFGVWATQYFPTFLIGGAETETGPGNTTPFANLAVGGTVNLLSPAFTKESHAQIDVGVDSYQTQFSDLKATGSLGHLSYVVVAGTSGYNGPFYQTNKCLVVPDNGGQNDNKAGNTGIIENCLDGSGSLFTKGEVLKLKYDFSQATSLELGFVGAWGGYSPQGSAWGQSVGPITIEPCLTANPQECTNPHFAGLTGSTISGYTWYTGSSLYNNQDIFDATFKQAIGNDTLLIRPYVADIEPEVINGGANQQAYTSYYSPVGASDAKNSPFYNSCTGGYGSTSNASGYTELYNGQYACYGSPYATYEQDKLYGSTISYLHPMGNSLLNLTYDFHGQSTFAYINAPADVSVPDTTVRYNTISLTGDIEAIRNVGINVGLYDTLWKVIGQEPELTAAGAPVVDANGNQVLEGYVRTISRFDPHFALTFHPNGGNLSYRAAVGSSATFPYAGQVSGFATYQQPAISLGPPFEGGGTLTEKNTSLDPEVDIAYDLGADYRLKNRSVLSGDLQTSVIHNVFTTLTTEKDLTTGGPICAGVDPCEGIFLPANVAQLKTESATVKYSYTPFNGWGYSISAAADRSILNGIPVTSFSAYNPALSSQGSVPTNGVQICGNGFAAPGIATCVPYLKGYASIMYRLKDGTRAALGADYEGKNNSYFQTPLTLLNFTATRPVSKLFALNLAVENLLNTNNDGAYLAEPNLGAPLVSGVTVNGALAQASFTPARINAAPRQVRLSGTLKF